MKFAARVAAGGSRFDNTATPTVLANAFGLGTQQRDSSQGRNPGPELANTFGVMTIELGDIQQASKTSEWNLNVTCGLVVIQCLLNEPMKPYR